MHPEIKKFWEDAGYEIEEKCPVKDPYNVAGNLEWRFTYYIKKSERYIDIPAVSDVIVGPMKEKPPITLYRLIGEKGWHSEEEMLRIIKMKAFL